MAKKERKSRQTSLIEPKPRFTNTEVLQAAQDYGLKGTYAQVYAALRSIRTIEAMGLVVSAKK